MFEKHTNGKSVVDLHFSILQSQGNVYTLSRLQMVDGTNSLLFASLKRKVYLINYQRQSDILLPTVREVHFTYIPGVAEILSIDAFNKSCSNTDDFVIGITIIKQGSQESEEAQYLNVYSEWDAGPEFNIDSIAQSCQSIELDFIPYHLYHCYLPSHDRREKEIVWLLSGSDCCIHLYREDKVKHCYSEVDVNDYFPEFEQMDSPTLWINVFYYNNFLRRVSGQGSESGDLEIRVYNLESKQIESTVSMQIDGPISSIKFFCLETLVTVPNSLKTWLPQSNDISGSCPSSPIHLLVTSMQEPAQLFVNITEESNNKVVLPQSSGYDSITCSCIADVDMDGTYEILIGTYGQELLAYKIYKKENNQLECKLEWHQNFAYPLLALDYVDLTGDGLDEFVIFTTKGLQISQHSLESVAELCYSRTRSAVEFASKQNADGEDR